MTLSNLFIQSSFDVVLSALRVLQLPLSLIDDIIGGSTFSRSFLISSTKAIKLGLSSYYLFTGSGKLIVQGISYLHSSAKYENSRSSRCFLTLSCSST
jgi:hypothetical protein